MRRTRIYGRNQEGIIGTDPPTFVIEARIFKNYAPFSFYASQYSSIKR